MERYSIEDLGRYNTLRKVLPSKEEAQHMIPTWIEEGKKYIWAELLNDREREVDCYARGYHNGAEIMQALYVISKLEEGEDYEPLYKELENLHDECLSDVCRLVLLFSKRGVEFARTKQKISFYVNDRSKQRELDFINSIEQRNEELGKVDPELVGYKKIENQVQDDIKSIMNKINEITEEESHNLERKEELTDDEFGSLLAYKLFHRSRSFTLRLHRLSYRQSELLGKFKGCFDFIFVDGLKEIDKKTARELGKFKVVSLDGLEHLDLETAKELSNLTILNLIGLKNIDFDVIRILSNVKYIKLNKNIKFDLDVHEFLLKHRSCTHNLHSPDSVSYESIH